MGRLTCYEKQLPTFLATLISASTVSIFFLKNVSHRINFNSKRLIVVKFSTKAMCQFFLIIFESNTVATLKITVATLKINGL